MLISILSVSVSYVSSGWDLQTAQAQDENLGTSSGVIQELLTWNFNNLNPDQITFSNPIRVMDGPTGHSLKFDGKNDYVRIASSKVGYVQDLTVSAWIKPNYNLTSEQFTIISKPESFSLYLKSDGQSHYAEFSVYDGTKWHTIESKTQIGTHWTRLLGIFDGRSIGIYVNGTIDSVDLVTTPTLDDLFPISYGNISTADVLIGSSENGLSENNFFAGQIDDVQVTPSDGYVVGSALENQPAFTYDNNTSTIRSNVTIPTNATNLSPALSSSNATIPRIPSNVTIPTNATNLSPALSISNATIPGIPLNATITSNTTIPEIPSNMPQPVRYFGFNLNSILPTDMTQNATITANGILGTALQLTGGYVSTSIPETDHLENLSLSVWIHPDYGTGGKTITIVNKANSFLLQIQNIAADQGTASFSIFDGITWHTVESKAMIPIGWTHLAATFNGTGISLYVNGILDSSQLVSTLGVSESGQLQSGLVHLNSDSNVLIGSQLGNQGADNQFNGLIDELAIFDVYLDSTQINSIFESTVKSTGFTPLTVLPPLIPENITITQIPIPSTKLNFSSTSQNKSNTFGDVSISTGVNGSALELSGSGYMSENLTSTNQISQFTISAWVKPDYQKGSAEYTILSKEKSFLLTIHNNLTPRKIALFSIFDGTTWHTVESKSKIPEIWTHLAATFNGTDISIYVNGLKESTLPVSSIGISIGGQLETKTIQNIESSADVLIGAQQISRDATTTVQGLFGGKIDEVQIYKSALSPSEIYVEYLKNAAAARGQIPSTVSNATVPMVPSNMTTLSNATLSNATTSIISSNTTAQSGITLPIAMSVKKLKTSYLMTESPEFVFEFISSDVLKKHGKSTSESFGEQQTGRWSDKNGTISVDVTDLSGKSIPVNVNFVKLRDGKFDIKLGSERAGKAGMYTMKITLAEGGKTYTTESTYAWGLVSLNTDKSIYRPGETANLVIVVLDNDGHSVCNSNIVMNIHDPTSGVTTLSTGNGITANPSCGLYDAQYVVPEVGNYTIDMTAQNPSGVANFTTSFLSADNFDFDVIRTSDSKIDPTSNPNSFDVAIDVSSFVNVNNVIIQESVPSSFKVSTDATVQTMGDVQILTWSKSLIGNKTSVSYTYSVPPVYPQLYALGPVQITSGSNTYFKEARPWFVAVDPSVNRLYLRAFTSPDAPTLGTHSAILPVGTFKGNSGTGFEDLSMSSVMGTATTSVTKTLTSIAQTAHQDNYIARFTSSSLAAQTIPAGTWTFALQTSEANNNANSFIVGSLYVWRPSTSSVVGYVYDSDTALGTEWGATTTGRVVTVTGSSVTTQDGDVLVFEMWRHAAQAANTGYVQTLYFDGTTDVTNGGTASAASYIQSGSPMVFGTLAASSVTSSDAVHVAVTRNTSLSDSVSVTDAVSVHAVKTVSLSDSASAADAVSTAASRAQSQSENTQVSDTVTTAVNMTKSTSDLITLSDTMTTSSGKSQSQSENTQVSDTVTTAVNMTKSTSDLITLSDTMTTSSGKSQSQSENTQVSDTVTTAVNMTKSTSDLITLSDTMTTSSGKSQSQSENTQVSDTVTTAVNMTKSTSDLITLSDIVAAQKSTSISINDTTELSDGLSAAASKQISNLDELTVTDTASLLKISPDQYLVPNNQTTVIVTPSKPHLIVTSSNAALSSIMIPTTVTSPTLSYATIVSSGTVHLLHSLNITKDTNGDNKTEVVVTIPAVTDISNSAWDGILQLPTLQSSSSLVLPTPQGQVATANTVIGMGSSLPLTFNNATRILFVGEAGSHVGYFYTPTSVTEIISTCTSDDQSVANGLAAGESCKINVGTSLVVWTKHFTGFVTWTLKPAPITPSAPQLPTASGGGYGTGVITPMETGAETAAGMLSTGVTLYDVTYDVCDKQQVQFTVGSPDSTTPTVEFATPSGVVEAKISSHQPYAGLYDLTKQYVLSYDAKLKPGTKSFNMLITPGNGTGYVTAKVDVTKCKQTVSFTPIPIIGANSPDAPKIFDVKLQIGNGTWVPATETTDEYITNQNVTISGLVYSPVPLSHAEIRTVKIDGNTTIGYDKVSATVTPTTVSHTYLVNATLPQDYLVPPATTYWIYANNAGGFESESDQYSIGVSPAYAVNGTIGFVIPQNVPAGLTQSPQVYFTNNSTGTLYGTISLSVDGKQVSQFVDHVFDRGTSVMELDWNVARTNDTTTHSVQAIATFYGHTIVSDNATVNAYVTKKIMSLENMVPLESLVDTQGNVVATPGSLYSSFVSHDGVTFHVVSPDGTCVVGESTACLVSESTINTSGRYSSITLDGTNYVVYYSGGNSTLERFLITSLQPITGNWKVSLEKNGIEQKDLETAVHLNIKYVPINKQLLVSLP
ncbi:MAG: hypothetical protein KGI05_00270 [Thaumarchaeota archaeon]|nr:hypothetical protein [Nitrososphaerota archaeon]